MEVDERSLGDEEYRHLLRLRVGLRQFLRWSEDRARAAGLTPAQHQLLLAIRGWPAAAPPTVSDLAGALLVRPHSAVGLIDRAAQAGLVRRLPDEGDRRVVHVVLSPVGARLLEVLSEQHLAELTRLASVFEPLLSNSQPRAPEVAGGTSIDSGPGEPGAP